MAHNYEKQNWVDGVDGGTPVSAERLNHIEEGIFEADGVPGPEGAQGPEGPQGIPGVKGNEGARGPEGIQGEMGPPGDSDIIGPEGPQGPPGVPGQNGINGENGSRGEDGAEGPEGPAGSDGQPGSDGRPGVDGQPGNDGQPGVDGQPGTPGQPGEQGPAGSKGDKGDPGVKGSTGLTGPEGPQGPRGFDGTDGTDGTGIKILGTLDYVGPPGFLPSDGEDPGTYRFYRLDGSQIASRNGEVVVNSSDPSLVTQLSISPKDLYNESTFPTPSIGDVLGLNVLTPSGETTPYVFRYEVVTGGSITALTVSLVGESTGYSFGLNEPLFLYSAAPIEIGDLWLDSNLDGWVWSGTSWENVGPIRGPQGEQGPEGIQGIQGPPGDAEDLDSYAKLDGSNQPFTGVVTGSDLKISGDNSGSVGLGASTLANQGTSSVARNTAVGFSAAANNAEGTENTALGAYAGRGASGKDMTASTFVGYQSGFDAEGDHNTGVGRSALSNTTGDGNTAIGALAGQSAAGRGTCVGNSAGLASGYGSTLVGFFAGTSSADALHVTALGYSAGRYSNESYELFVNSLDRLNRNGDKTKSIIYGVQAADVADQVLHLNAKVTAASDVQIGEAAGGAFRVPTLGENGVGTQEIKVAPSVRLTVTNSEPDTDNLQEWQTSNGTTVASVSASGVVDSNGLTFDGTPACFTTGGLSLPGTDGNYASCPASASFNTTDIDVRWFGSLDDWNSPPLTGLVGHYDDELSWAFMVNTDGRLRVLNSSDGSSQEASIYSTVDPNTVVADGETIGVRWVLDASTNSKFYTSTDDGVTWDQLGATVTTGIPVSLFPSTSILAVGQVNSTQYALAGTVKRVEIRDGVDGTIVANPDFTRAPVGVDSVGNLWKIHGDGASYACAPYPSSNLDEYAKLDSSNQPFTGVVDCNGLAFDGTPVTGTVLSLPGIGGNYASAPYDPRMNIAGDFEIRWFGSRNSWTSGTVGLVSRYNTSDAKRQFTLQGITEGSLRFFYSETGGGVPSSDAQTSTVPVPFSDGGTGGVRLVLEAATGDVTFYTSTDDGVTWDQLGDVIAGDGPATLFESDQPLVVGETHNGAYALNGTVSRVEILDGTRVVANPDFTHAPVGVDSAGNAWEVHGDGASYVFAQPASLHEYAKLDGSNQPFTGDIQIGEAVGGAFTADILGEGGAGTQDISPSVIRPTRLTVTNSEPDTGHVQEWQSSDGGTLARISAEGNLNFMHPGDRWIGFHASSKTPSEQHFSGVVVEQNAFRLKTNVGVELIGTNNDNYPTRFKYQEWIKEEGEAGYYQSKTLFSLYGGREEADFTCALKAKSVNTPSVTIPNQAEAPPTPTGGGTLFVQDGALKYIGSEGTVTTIGQA